jgi:hypothetical protein
MKLILVSSYFLVETMFFNHPLLLISQSALLIFLVGHLRCHLTESNQIPSIHSSFRKESISALCRREVPCAAPRDIYYLLQAFHEPFPENRRHFMLRQRGI